jgi:Flp pilus assembly protein TadG
MPIMPRFCRPSLSKLIANDSGQAMVEFAFVVPLLLILVCGAIDFGRALNDMQIMADLTRQGSNLASRGTPLNESTAAVVSGESGLDLVHEGEVIITSVTNESGSYKITGQDSSTTDGLTKLSVTSKIGTGVGNPATLPAAAQSAIPQSGQTLFVTEVFYTFSPATPVGALTSSVISLPTTLYDTAYF